MPNFCEMSCKVPNAQKNLLKDTFCAGKRASVLVLNVRTLEELLKNLYKSGIFGLMHGGVQGY